MTEVGSESTCSASSSPLSFRNAPQATKTTQRIGGSSVTDGMELSSSTPRIEQMYDPSQVKSLPGKGRKDKPEFVNWGTKLYQLELELSYKSNEIVVLQKKIKKLANELYPGGDTNKKPIVQSLRNQNEVLQKRISTKDRQLKWEQRRCRGLEHELAAARKENKELRKSGNKNEKAVQTLPTNHEAVQVGSVKKRPKTRTVMTQCTPTVIRVTNSTSVTSARSPNDGKTAIKYRTAEYRASEDRNFKNSSSSTILSKSLSSSMSSVKSNPSYKVKTVAENVTVENNVKVEVVPKGSENFNETDPVAVISPKNQISSSQQRIPSKPGVQFATAMTIKETPESAQEIKDPLEMSITQEFDKENSVKTVVQSNRDFEIKQKPVILSQNSQVIGGIEHVTRPEYLRLSRYGSDCDSGHGSYASDRGSPSTVFRSSQSPVTTPRSAKVSYKQILEGATATRESSIGDRIYERNIPDFMSSTPHPPKASSSERKDTRFNTTAWEIYNRGSAKSNPAGVVPYYLFKRSNESGSRKKASEKPIFVHVSEIVMQ